MKKLFDKQAKLDDIILKNLCARSNMEITHRQLIEKRLLAAMVEVGEFIKEKDHNKKLTEYADILHFLESCGLALEISECISKYDIAILYAQSTENSYEGAILNFVVKFSEFTNNVRTWKYWSVDRKPRNIEKHYFKCFLAFFDLAKSMGYTVQEIKAAYYDKNAENIARQENGY